MIQQIRLNLNQTGIPATAYASQTDVKRELQFLIYEDSSVYSFPTGSKVSINGQKPDGYLFYYEEGDTMADGTEIITKSGNVVTVKTTPQMTAVYGDVACQIRITKDGADLGTINFNLRVKATPLADEQGYSKTDIPAIVKLAQEQEEAAEAAAGEAQDSAEAAGESEDHASTSEINAAASAQTAEDAATLAESWAVGGTDTRTGEDTNNAKYYAESIIGDADAAAASAQAAAASATAAGESEDNAEASATLSESWATGGTSSRAGEDTNNSKYFSERSAASATAAATSEINAYNSAVTAGNSATASASSASASDSSAEDSEAWAVGERDGVAVESTDETYHNNSKYYSEQSGTSATASANSATASNSSAEDSEAWAVGQRDGTDVDITDETYHNNSKYYSEQSGTSATASATSASASASSATASASSATEAESWAVGGTGTRTGEDTNNAEYWARAAQAAADLEFMENDRMGIGKPDKLTAVASNGTFTALGVAIRCFINEDAAEFSSQWLMDALGNILTPDVRQLYRVVEDTETGVSSLYYWTGTAYEMISAGGGSDIYIGDVSGAAATTFARTASITWSDPGDVVIDGVTLATWGGTLLVRKAGSAPESRSDGTVILNSTTRNAYASTPFVDTNLEYGVTYYYKFFPYTSGRKYTTGSGVSVTPARVPITPTPTITEALTYDGTEQSVTINYFDTSKMTVEGDEATLAGTHTATLRPREGYCWNNQTYGALELNWVMNKASVEIPETADGFTYDGTTHEAITSTYDTNIITVSGTHSASEVNRYSFTMALNDTDNYQWENNTTAPITKQWRIVAELLSVPTVTANLTYDGTPQSPTIGTYDTTKIRLVSGDTGTNAGTYNVVFHIIDPDSYLWSDETSADKSVEWSIAPQPLTPPSVSANLTYTGSEQSATVSAYDSTLISITGITGTNAGDYTATISLIDDDNYCWSDNTTADKTATWSIAKAAGYCYLIDSSTGNPKYTTELSPDLTSDTFQVSTASALPDTVTSSDSTVATGSISGSVITASSVNDTNGTATLTLHIPATSNYLEATQTIGITCAFAEIYGVEWDGTSSSAMTRTDMAASFTDPVPAVNNGNGSSPFDNILPWSGMERVTDANAGTLVKIPKFWYKLTTTSAGTFKLQISPEEQDGFNVSPAHQDRGDGVGERDYVYVGAYHCATSTYKSTTGVNPAANDTRANFRTYIHNLGSDIWQWDKAMLTTIQMLYLVEYADWNSQAKIGAGCSDAGAVQAAGLCDTMVYHTGTNAADRATYGHVRYRYIEDLWANVRDWLDGLYLNNASVYSIMNPANFSDTIGGTFTGFDQAVNGDIKKMEQSNVSGLDWFYWPTEIISDSTYSTYVCDYGVVLASYVVVYVGGSSNQYPNFGLFYQSSYSATGKNAGVGSRLQKLPAA